ncbi:MAG TPA: 30S ribosomal protein S8 [Candidatus Omnitrophica bacterium]|nr:30S ribosomal protein S8 [Candidatus Omnitrophota bacterium]
MSLSDPIANMLTLIRNAARAKKDKADVPHSAMLTAIAGILKQEGYIDNYRVIKDSKQGVLRLYLKYINKKSVIINLKRVSRPGLRVYAGVKEIPRVLRGKGTVILTTSHGLMTDVQAREAKIGGEVLCYIW